MIKRLEGLAGQIYRGRGSAAAAMQSLLTKFIVLGLNAGTSLVVARLLRPEGRGEMSAMIVWSGFLSGLLTFGLPSAVIFDIQDKPAARARTVGTALTLTLVLTVLVAAIGYVALPFWLSKYSAHEIMVARWFLLSSPIPLFLSVGRGAMEASGGFSQSNFALWCGPLLTLLFLAGFAVTHTLTPVTGGLAYVLGNVPGTLWLIKSVWQEYRPELKDFAASSRMLLHYGLRSWGVDLLAALGAQADQVLIVRFLSPAAMGTYIVAASFARLIGVFQTSTVMVLFPRVAARTTSEVVSLTSLTARITSACALVTALTLGLAGPYMLGAIYGPAYVQEGTTVFRILLLEVVFGGATQTLAQAFMASGRPGIVTIVQGLGVGVGIACMPVLILRFGVAGAAGALLMSSVIRLVLTLFCFRAILKMPTPSLFPKRSDFSFVGERIRGLYPKPELVTT